MEAFDVNDQFASVLIAVGWSLRQALFDDPLQFHRHAGTQRCHRFGLFVEDRIQNRLVIVALERQLACDHLVQHHSQRPDIGARVDRVSQRLLRRHVRCRAHAGVDSGKLRRSRHLGQAEIHQLGHRLARPVLAKHDVRGLDVAVHNPSRMRGGKRFGSLPSDFIDHLKGQRPLFHALVERLTIQVRHHEELLLFLRMDLVESADVGMV